MFSRGEKRCLLWLLFTTTAACVSNLAKVLMQLLSQSALIALRYPLSNQNREQIPGADFASLVAHLLFLHKDPLVVGECCCHSWPSPFPFDQYFQRFIFLLAHWFNRYLWRTSNMSEQFWKQLQLLPNLLFPLHMLMVRPYYWRQHPCHSLNMKKSRWSLTRCLTFVD